MSSTGAQSCGGSGSSRRRRPRHYENVEDAIVMWCNDLTSEAYGAHLDKIRREQS